MKPPASQFYYDDFLAGTQDMTAEEVGVYMRLLCHGWNKGGIENDERRVGILVGQCHGAASAVAMEVLRRKFKLGDDGLWRNARQESIRAKQQERREQQGHAADVRWERERATKAQPHPPATPPSAPQQPAPAKASAGAKPKLSAAEQELAVRFEKCLNGQWPNDAGKWIMRIKGVPRKCERVIAEVESAVRENRIKTTPAQYAEKTWNEFK